MVFRPGGGPMRTFGEAEKSRDTRGTLLRLWGYLKRQRWTLAGTANNLSGIQCCHLITQ
jgi:hypothetical protein